mmetsp:Transcript_84363/g.239286  ORF Transcript_84363/g.239286 Transcript_84363/m.239286 type:complete len:217 (+) Transcript_84363:400-1050(+)
MFWASLTPWPVTPDLLTFSEPARSMRLILPWYSLVSFSFRDLVFVTTCTMLWDRLDSSFMSVAITVRFADASCMAFSTSSTECTASSVRPGTELVPSGFVLISSFFCFVTNRSLIVSLYISVIIREIVMSVSSLRSSRMRKSSVRTRVLSPGLLSLPVIVNVFPDPVWPYAKMQTLKPSSTDVASGFTSSYTSCCAVFGGNALSNSNHFRRALFPS